MFLAYYIAASVILGALMLANSMLTSNEKVWAAVHLFLNLFLLCSLLTILYQADTDAPNKMLFDFVVGCIIGISFTIAALEISKRRSKKK